MKRTGIRRPTYEEAVAKQRAKAQKRLLSLTAKGPKLPRPAPKPKPKANRIKTLKTKLWAAFSRYIRKSYANQYGMVHTCDGEYKPWQETHCGHLINNSERSQSAGGNALWYDERNFAPQTSNGNYFNANDSAKKYMLWAVKKYGAEAVDEMFRLKFQVRKFTEEELLAKLEHYEQAFNKLSI